jgi:predicted Zn-dependent protease
LKNSFVREKRAAPSRFARQLARLRKNAKSASPPGLLSNTQESLFPMPSFPEDYSNPEVKEGINVSPEHPLKEFAWLVFGALAVLLAAFALFSSLGYIVSKTLPFEKEKAIADLVEESLPPSSQKFPEEEKWLRRLTDKLLAADPLPKGMSVSVRLSDNEIPNAYTTLGGYIVVNEGLLERANSENAIAMVLAHEIAHVRFRHVIQSMSRQLLMKLLLSAFSGATNSDVASALAGEEGITTELPFSRHQEEDADLRALETLNLTYGHVGGATSFLEMTQDLAQKALPESLSTHPDHARRKLLIENEIRKNHWQESGKLEPFPFKHAKR